jgi:hypothetical protein
MKNSFDASKLERQTGLSLPPGARVENKCREKSLHSHEILDKICALWQIRLICHAIYSSKGPEVLL